MLLGEEVKLFVKKIDIEEAKKILSEGFTSGIGHKTTADVLSVLLKKDIPANRIEIKINPGDTVVVFQLLRRIEEGRILSESEIMNLPTQFYLVKII
jgi:hypothetical protein